jgi:predicted MFS family arabinose efflux permease
LIGIDLDRLRRAAGADLGPAFRWLMASDALTLLALMVGQVALPWWIATQGGAHDLAVYGVVVAAFAIVAMPLLSPLGDRVPKRRLVVIALCMFAAASVGVATLASVGHYRLVVLIALGVVPVLAMAALVPSISSFTTELVPPASLGRAMGLQQSAQATGRMIGPALGGAVLGLGGIATTLWLNAALLLGAALASRRVPPGVPPARERRAWRADLMAGMRANWAIPLERGWILVNFLSWIFLFPTFTILLPLKVKALGLSGAWLGFTEAGLSLGMLAGSLGGASWMVARFGRFGTRVGGACVQGVALALAGATTSGPWLVAGFTVAGLMNAAMVLVGMGHRMLARPQAFRARMVAGAVTTTHVASMIGPALAGLALTQAHAGIAPVFVAFGLTGAVFSLGLALVPGFRAFMALDHEQVAGFYERCWPEAFRES